ncbi:hypothetical protein [Sphingomonas sp. SRS2]|uniref:hypothetical protein n=1 Tax=Sphingomonas sp. SRS2 TaxID=133190 RepID=UPI0006990D98|nr:hypothetical protein [Sphingomonas sp. SRS2]
MRLVPAEWKTLAQFLYLQRITGFTVPQQIYFAGAEDAFRERLAQSRSYLEYGSGSSTLIAAHAGVPTVSVEGDRFFARAVNKALPAGASVRFALPDIGLTVGLCRPFNTTPTARRMRRWARYVAAPWPLLDGFPDFILTDGRFRLACMLDVVRRARDGGHRATLMCDDYANRPRYHAIEAYIGAPRLVGRAAFFEVGPDDQARAITPEIVHAALTDWY